VTDDLVVQISDERQPRHVGRRSTKRIDELAYGRLADEGEPLQRRELFVMGSTHEEVSGVEVEVSPTWKLGRFFKAEIERIIALSEPYDPAA
jgi:hypothetical protein